MDRMDIEKKLDRYKLTDFQKKVLIAVYAIPKGETRTYREIAKQVGRRNAYRAVGTALRKNPIAQIVPCHRVIRSSGDIGNYSGTGGRAAKARLLKQEGWRPLGSPM